MPSRRMSPLTERTPPTSWPSECDEVRLFLSLSWLLAQSISDSQRYHCQRARWRSREHWAESGCERHAAAIIQWDDSVVSGMAGKRAGSFHHATSEGRIAGVGNLGPCAPHSDGRAHRRNRREPTRLLGLAVPAECQNGRAGLLEWAGGAKGGRRCAWLAGVVDGSW